jgi:DNA helicase HerA-like ATPase
MKQARAYGVGVLLATQNPMDLDYRVLSNAGVWFVGRLQTDADRARVVEAMASAPAAAEESAAEGPDGGEAFEPAAVADVIKRLAPRWFVVRNVHRAPSLGLLQSRTTLTWLRGPMTRADLRRVSGGRDALAAEPALATEAESRPSDKFGGARSAGGEPSPPDNSES